MKRNIVLTAALLLVFVLTLSPMLSAQERDTDTLMVVDTNIPVGDTVSLPIYIANTDTVGGYTLRCRFDPLVLGVVTVLNDSTADVTPLRGGWFTFAGGIPEAGVITLVAAFPKDTAGMVTAGGGAILGMDVGRGNTVGYRFFAQPGVTAGTTTQIVFEDAAFDTNAYNWFSHWSGLFQYRPKRVAGTITITGGGLNDPPTISPISSPIAAALNVPLSFPVNATDPDADPVTLTAFDLPAGAQFGPPNPVSGTGSVSGTFSWTPGVADIGQHVVRFQANDDHSNFSGFTNVTINVSGGGAPTISPLTSPISTSQGSIVEFSVQATDPEGEEVTLTASNLPAGADFTPANPVIGTGSVSGLFRWAPGFSQSGSFTVQFQAEDEIGNISAVSSVVINVAIVPLDQLFTTSAEGQSPQGGVPGATGVLVPINFVTTELVYGVQFDFIYDATVMTVTDLVPSTRLDGFSIYEDIGDSPGRIKVVTFSLSGDPINASGSVVFEVVGTISPQAIPGRYDLNFEDAWESINPDPGVPAKQLATTPGHLFVDVLGDVNANGLIEVDDLVSVVGNILGSYSFTSRQFGAGNVITDALIDVFDLVGIINLIYGLPVQTSPYDPGDEFLAKVEFIFDPAEGVAGAYRLLADVPTEVAGIQVELVYDPLQIKLVPPEPSASTNGFDFQYQDNRAGRMTVIMYAFSNPDQLLPIGENEIFGLSIEPGPAGIPGELPEVQLRNVKLSTREASKINVAGAGVPQSFELYQNYPNPFNPRTVIEFDLAPQGDEEGAIETRLSVYNILGRRVATLVDRPLAPGRHSVEWSGTTDNGDQVGSGIYFYKLVAGEHSESKKMVLLK